jgi:hypothetical protein
MGPGGMGPTPGRATWACLLLERLLSSVLISDWQAWPKNHYIKTPEAFSWGGGTEKWNHETEIEHAKIGGGPMSQIGTHTSTLRGAIVIPCSWGLYITFLVPLLRSVALKLLFLCALDFSFTFSFVSFICFTFSLFYIFQSSKLWEVYFFNLFDCDFVFSLFSILHHSIIMFSFIFTFPIHKSL